MTARAAWLLAALVLAGALAAPPVFAKSVPAAQFVFCARYPVECAQVTQPLAADTPATRQIIRSVVASVRRQHVPVEDTGAFPDEWHPRARGDCEDAVLLARKILREKHGVPATMRIGLLRDGRAHAVLVVPLASGREIVVDVVNTGPLVRVLKTMDVRNPTVWR